jgi:abortive infection bacteriophage resistance protein
LSPPITVGAVALSSASILEVTFRSRLAYYMAMAMPIDGYLDPSFYLDRQAQYGAGALRDTLIADIADQLRRSKEKFVAHHVAAGEVVPIYAAVEVFSFGTLSKLYGLLAQRDVWTKVSKSFGLPAPSFTANVMRVVRRASECMRPPLAFMEPSSRGAPTSAQQVQTCRATALSIGITVGMVRHAC